ncbi:unnamed protein product [Caenorhabditis nigoni]
MFGVFPALTSCCPGPDVSEGSPPSATTNRGRGRPSKRQVAMDPGPSTSHSKIVEGHVLPPPRGNEAARGRSQCMTWRRLMWRSLHF